MADELVKPQVALIKVSGVQHEVPLHPQFHEWKGGQQRRYLESMRRNLITRLKWREIVVRRANTEKFEPRPLTYRPPDYELDPAKPKYIIRVVYGPLCGLELSQVLVLRYKEKYLRRHTGGIDKEPNQYLAIHPDGTPVEGAEWTESSWKGTGPGGGSRVREGQDDLVTNLGDNFEGTKIVPDPRTGKARRVSVDLKWGPRELLWNLFRFVAEHHGDCAIFLVHNEQELRVDPHDFEEWVRRSQEDPVKALLEPAQLLTDRRSS
jgi:hypothetical protein